MTKGQAKQLFRGVFLMGLAVSLAAPCLWAKEDADKPRGVGLSVEPGGMLIQNVVPGETYDLAQRSGVSLKVSNRDARARTYVLSAQQPSGVGNHKWLPGYFEIPDPSWFWCEPNELAIEPEGDGSAKMYLKVPEGDEYYNQHWVVSVGVQGKPGPGETLALAAFPRYQIETEAKADTEAVPAGSLGIKPSLLQFVDLPLGEWQEASITVYNNESISQRYTLTAKTISVNRSREQIVPSPGYIWVPNPNWITPRKKRVKIGEKKSYAVDVRVKIPNKPEYHEKRWEVLLWIEPDEGSARFARIQIETNQASPAE